MNSLSQCPSTPTSTGGCASSVRKRLPASVALCERSFIKLQALAIDRRLSALFASTGSGKSGQEPKLRLRSLVTFRARPIAVRLGPPRERGRNQRARDARFKFRGILQPSPGYAGDGSWS
jgi:hypothetical protein